MPNVTDLLRNMRFPEFSPPHWMRNAHFQTIVASRKPRRWSYGWRASETLEIELGADGKLLAEASWQPGERSASPALFLMHGLEGSAQSHYLLGMSKKAFAAGFHAIRINTRNCGGTEHLTPTLYCAGLSQDVGSVLRHLREVCGIREIYAAGVSLGANILLKYLGEQGSRAGSEFRGVAVLSPPIDLLESALKMLEPQNFIYQRYFVKRLKERIRRKLLFYPSIADRGAADRVRTVYDFDDVITAPHFGWGTAENYYKLASSGPILKDIRVPTLIVQAKDDPMIPFHSFSNSGIRKNPWIRLLATDHGGHAGFLGWKPAVSGDADSYWGECRIVQFLSEVAGPPSET